MWCVSIKVLNIALVLLCIVMTAFLCTFFAISSSNTALDDTKSSRDYSVDSCFAVGGESVQNRTYDYTDLLMMSTIDHMHQFFDRQRQMPVEMADELMSHEWDDIKRWEWHRMSRYYWPYHTLRGLGSTGVLIMLRNKLMMYMYESGDTVLHDPSAYHELKIRVNYGDDHPQGGYQRSFETHLMHGTGLPYNVVNPLTDVNWNYSNCSQGIALATNGSQYDEPCIARGYDDPSTNGIYGAGHLFSEGSWGYPYTNANNHLIVALFAPIRHNGVYSGVAVSGADLRQISSWMARIKVGGPIGGYPSRGRLFITVRTSFMIPSSVGKLLGSSHGGVTVLNQQGSIEAIYPANSTDDIVKRAGEITENKTAHESGWIEGLAANSTVEELNITTDYAPEGEPFYYRVGYMNDDYGIDWFLHVLLDRAYIMESIEEKLDETRSGIASAEKKVEDDLTSARAVLYGLVVSTAVVLITVSVVFVLKIIEPLVMLEREMAMVSLMKLEFVDRERPFSMLQEVRLMQRSFLKMTENLIEYRNYMPASVLEDTDDEEDGNTSQSSATITSKSVTSSQSGNCKTTPSNTLSAHASAMTLSQHSSTKVDMKQNILQGTEAKSRRVTLMSCNVVSFLGDSNEGSHILAMVNTYLSMALHHVKVTKGIPDIFSGDRLYVSWNGAKNCATHRTAAYVCSMGIISDTSLGKKYSIGLVSGEVKCGNMGCDRMKKYSFVGSLASWMHIVERVGRMAGAEVVIDKVVKEEIENLSYSRTVQHVMYPKHSLKTLLVFEVMAKKQMIEEEWMYQLDEKEKNDPHKAYNKSYTLFMAGDVEGAVRELEVYASGGVWDSVVQRYREKLQRAIDHPILCDPYGKHEGLVS